MALRNLSYRSHRFQTHGLHTQISNNESSPLLVVPLLVLLLHLLKLLSGRRLRTMAAASEAFARRTRRGRASRPVPRPRSPGRAETTPARSGRPADVSPPARRPRASRPDRARPTPAAPGRGCGAPPPTRRPADGAADTRRASVHAGFGSDRERWTGYPTAPGDGTGTTARDHTEDNAHAR